MPLRREGPPWRAARAQKLQLNWNRGEEAMAVADRFIKENGLDPRHKGDVIAFVTDAMQKQQMSAGGGPV